MPFFWDKIKKPTTEDRNMIEGDIKMRNKDESYEGKKQLYLDIDRMINEGMAGGTVADKEDLNQIGYTTGITEQEDPPIEAGDQEEADETDV
jgi:hypothetical protein